MASLPLVVFYSFTSRDTFVRELQLRRDDGGGGDSGPLMELEESHLDVYRGNPQSEVAAVYITVCRAPGGPVGFMQKAARLFPYDWVFSVVYVFHPELPAHGTYHGYEENGRVLINYTVHEVLDALGAAGAVNDAQRSRLQQCLHPTNGGGAPNAELLRRMRQLPAPLPQPLVGEDPDLQQAIRASLQDDEERRSRPPAADLASIIAAWPLLSEERAAAADQHAVPGDPVCTVCLENRVAICLVPCGHQTVCDRCVRVIWTQSTLRRACPTCRGEVSGVVRPIAGAIATAGAVAEKPAKKKQRRKTNKK